MFAIQNRRRPEEKLGIAFFINRQIQKYGANHNKDGPKTKTVLTTFFSTLPVLYTLWSIFSKSSHQAIHSRAEQSSHSTARVYPLGLTPSGPPERSAGNRASLRYREVGKHMRIMLPYREAAPPPSTTYFTSIY